MPSFKPRRGWQSIAGDVSPWEETSVNESALKGRQNVWHAFGVQHNTGSFPQGLTPLAIDCRPFGTESTLVL
jgi:hypothetical protein